MLTEAYMYLVNYFSVYLAVSLVSPSQVTAYSYSSVQDTISAFYFKLNVLHSVTSLHVCLHFLLSTANCSEPTAPGNGVVEPYQSTLEGAEIIFMCNPGFVPAGRMRAVCAADGSWTSDPAALVCTCEIFIVSPNPFYLHVYLYKFIALCT